MKKEQSSTSSFCIVSYKIISYFCVTVFFLSTILFLYLFFYQSFKDSYDTFKDSMITSPKYETPNISIPEINYDSQTTQKTVQKEENINKEVYIEEKPSFSNINEDQNKPAIAPTPSLPVTPIAAIEDPSIKEAKRIFVAYELGDFSLASRLIVDFLSEYPDSIYKHKIRLIGANLMNQRGDYEGALGYIQKILGESNLSNEDYSESVLLLGEIARERKQFDSYIQSFLEQAYFRAEEPTKSKLSFYLGYLLLNKGDFQSSLRYFNNVIGEDGVLGKSDLYAAQQMRPERINELENFIRAYPSSKNFDYVTNSFIIDVMRQGEELSTRGYLDSAERFYQKILKYFSNSLNGDEARMKIADLYYQRQDIPRAMRTLQEVLENDNTTRDPDALFALGKMSFDINKQEEALGYLRIISEKYPDFQYSSKVREWQNLILESLRN